MTPEDAADLQRYARDLRHAMAHFADEGDGFYAGICFGMLAVCAAVGLADGLREVGRSVTWKSALDDRALALEQIRRPSRYLPAVDERL